MRLRPYLPTGSLTATRDSGDYRRRGHLLAKKGVSVKKQLTDLSRHLRETQKMVLSGIDTGAAKGDPKKVARMAKAAVKEMFGAMQTLLKLFATSQR